MSSLPQLILLCKIELKLNVSHDQEKILRNVLEAAVTSKWFKTASLFLFLKENESQLIMEEPRPLLYDSNSRKKYEECRQLAVQCNGEVVSSTLPLVLKESGASGNIEVYVRGAGTIKNELVNKAMLLARHVGDILQEVSVSPEDLKLRKLIVWLETVSLINSTLELQKILHLVSQLIADLFIARVCIFGFMHEEQAMLPQVAVGSYDQELKKEFKALKGKKIFPAMKEAMVKRMPVHINPKNLQEMIPEKFIDIFNFKCAVVAPIMKGSKVYGFMLVDRPGSSQLFSLEEGQMLFALAKEAAIAIENAKLVEELNDQQNKLHFLVKKIIEVQEQERRRIASDLHDGVIQTQLGLWYRLQKLTKLAEKDSSPLAKDLASATIVMEQQIYEMRMILSNLRPAALENYGAIPAIQAFVETTARESGLSAEFMYKGDSMRLPNEVETSLYRIVQEGVANIVKHAKAKSVAVKINQNCKEILLKIEDDGMGFNVKPSNKYEQGNEGFGLVTIEERAKLLNGSFELKSRLGIGTQLIVRIPLKSGRTNDG